MPRIFWPNFDFEHELAIGTSWRIPPRLRARNAQLAPRLASLAVPGDLIATPDGVADPIESGIQFVSQSRLLTDSSFHTSEWELIPWGVTSSLEQLAQRNRWRWNQPNAALVKTLNDRQTSYDWEAETNTLPVATRAFDFVADLLDHLATFARPWVIKSRFGMSGRERILGGVSPLSDAQSGWIRKRLREQGRLFFEPWFERVDEVGLQLEIPQTGEVRVLAVTPMINSPQGEYLGSGSHLSDLDRQVWIPAIRLAERIATRFQQAGYFGPLGIDAMRYRQGEDMLLRPAQDINARWTMGRLTWEDSNKK